MLNSHQKAKYIWRCRRGMLELDLILQRFLETHLECLSSQDIKVFDSLLSCTDPELFAWLMGHEEPQNTELKKIVAIIRDSN